MSIRLVCYHCDSECEFNDEDEAKAVGWRQNDERDWFCEECNCTCGDCGEIIFGDIEDEMYWVEGRDEYICSDCHDDHYFVCERCGDLEHTDYERTVVIRNEIGDIIGEENWCENCANENAHWDDDNDEYWIIRGDNNNTMNGVPQYDLESDETMCHCEECQELGRTCAKCLRKQAELLTNEETHLWVYDNTLRQYHPQEHRKFKSLKFRELHEHPYLFYGIELELIFNTNANINTIAREFINATNGLFVAETDSSVSAVGNGCEFISRPLSYKKWMSEEVHHLLDEGRKVLDKYNANNPQPVQCGLHVHMSLRFFEKNTEKKVKQIKSDLDWMLQIFQPEIEKLSRREYTRYCASKASRIKQALQNNSLGFNLDPTIILNPGELTISRGSGETHHDAIIQTPKTIEVRTFRSTVDVTEILSTIEFCRAIAHASRNLEINTNTTLEDILYCKDNRYLDAYIKKQKVDTSKTFANKLEVKL